MHYKQKLSVHFHLQFGKINSAGELPIWARITIDGRRSECSTSIYVLPIHWDNDTQRATGKCPLQKEINENLNEVYSAIKTHFTTLLATSTFVTASQVKESLLGKRENKTFLEVFSEFNKHLDDRLAVNDISQRRHDKFKMLYFKCKEFISRKYGRTDVLLNEVKLNFLKEFELFYRKEYKSTANTSMKAAKDLKQITKYAVMLEYTPSDPFAFFKCAFQKTNREYLTAQELKILQSKVFRSKRLDEVRDCYIFCCYTGYAYIDAKDLQPQDVKIGLDGERWIMKERTKTSNDENVPLLPVAETILKQYSNNPYCVANNKLLPLNSNQKYNQYLKEIAALCGINKKLTSHTARHTFATTVLLSNGVPLETTMELMGHQDMRTTLIYGRIVQEKVSADMKKLKAKLRNKE